jgi:hypothetical protein
MAAVDLYWLPLGAGGHFVRLNGRLYEALAARLERRPARDLYHSALQVELPEGTFVIEQAPVHDKSGEERGVVAEGAVGARWAGRFRIFRYEIRLWPDGHIPDVAEAVDSPSRLSDDEESARRVLELVRQVPTPVWGRDQLGAGEMWNSNSVIAWVIARSALDAESIRPPRRGRAPGWQAGLVVAHRQDSKSRAAADKTSRPSTPNNPTVPRNLHRGASSPARGSIARLGQAAGAHVETAAHSRNRHSPASGSTHWLTAPSDE